MVPPSGPTAVQTPGPAKTRCEPPALVARTRRAIRQAVQCLPARNIAKHPPHFSLEKPQPGSRKSVSSLADLLKAESGESQCPTFTRQACGRGSSLAREAGYCPRREQGLQTQARVTPLRSAIVSKTHSSILRPTGVAGGDACLPLTGSSYHGPDGAVLAPSRVYPVRADPAFVIGHGAFHRLDVYQLLPTQQLAQPVVSRLRTGIPGTVAILSGNHAPICSSIWHHGDHTAARHFSRVERSGCGEGHDGIIVYGGPIGHTAHFLQQLWRVLS